MERLPFVLRFGQETAQKPLSDAERETLLQTLAAAGAENFSIWQIEDFWFCYGEYSELRGAEAAAQALCAVAGAELFAAPGTLPLMYHCIGLVRADKSHIRHRVFSTRLKEGCAAWRRLYSAAEPSFSLVGNTRWRICDLSARTSPMQ